MIALTHMRVPNDMKLAREVQELDLVLGGHDHHYEMREASVGKVWEREGGCGNGRVGGWVESVNLDTSL